MAFDFATMQTCNGLWLTSQTNTDAPEPAHEWIEFFVKTFIDSINEDGSYGMPIYAFVNDNSEMVIVPTKPDTEEEDA